MTSVEVKSDPSTEHVVFCGATKQASEGQGSHQAPAEEGSPRHLDPLLVDAHATQQYVVVRHLMLREACEGHGGGRGFPQAPHSVQVLT